MSPKDRPLPFSEMGTSTRDHIFSIGAGVCAFFALAALNAPNIALLFGLVMAFLAFRSPVERRPGRLMMAGFGLAVWLFFVTVVWYALAFGTLANETSDNNSFYVTLSRESTIFATLDVVGGVALTLAALLAGVALYRTDQRRFRVLSWSGWGITIYYLLTLPDLVWASAAPEGPGSPWLEPVLYLSVVLGIFAGLAVSLAFAWYSPRTQRASRLSLAGREYLLSIAAFSLVVPWLAGFGTGEWSAIARAPEDTLTTAVIRGIVYLSWRLLIPALLLTGTIGFLIAARQAGWTLNRWASLRRGDAPLTSGKRVLLTWRLPLLYVWLLALVAACSFLGYYGLAALVPAAMHYLWMLTRGRDQRGDRAEEPPPA